MALTVSMLQAVAAAAVGLGVGHALELLASQQLFGLHLVPLGADEGADVWHIAKHPAPFGEHGWLPLPLALFDMLLLLWDGQAQFRDPESFWARCKGAIWGQLRIIVYCCLSILPTVLSAWLLWFPWRCAPLACLIAVVDVVVSLTALLFWSDLLFLLPRARAEAATAKAGVRRAVLCLCHVAFFALQLSPVALVLEEGANETDATSNGCSELSTRLESDFAGVLDQLTREAVAQTPQGSMSVLSLGLQLICACLCIFIVLDSPQRPSEDELWGPMD